MIKKILKVLYIGFAAVIAFFVYIFVYSANVHTHIQRLTQNAIKESTNSTAVDRYYEVAKIHGSWFDKRSIITEDSDKLDMVVFPATILSTITYYPNAEDKNELKKDYLFENSYYIYVFHPTFAIDNQSINGQYKNQTGIRFYAGDTSCDYYYTVSSVVNATKYKEKPVDYKEYFLNGERDLISGYNDYGFFNLVLTQKMVESMELNGNVQALGVLNSSGEEEYKIEVNLDFSQQFFTDIHPLVSNYNTYIDEYNAAQANNDKAAKQAAVDKFSAFYESKDGNKGFEENFLENENYILRYNEKYITPSKLVWKTIALLILYIICVVLIYILLFHFAFLKAIIFREKHNTYRRNVAPQTKTASKAADVIDVKPRDITEVKEEKVETSKQEDIESQEEVEPLEPSSVEEVEDNSSSEEKEE